MEGRNLLEYERKKYIKIYNCRYKNANRPMYANIELQKSPPLLVEISSYGANEGTYYKVTGIQGTFNRELMK
ncbi:hypothetical protein NQ527_11930 [Eshraghiella crossota]|uniref:Uncharacterized protein n=1 Tax=Eshraghiella crossota DSM 2876 TaxID=511680 RepID=D4RXR7_9FIRM|nr:hypothetical protein [Butyrivibrio crossotus]EFF69149.1 hypothetical protein BUTYVIB_00618 [Butyrivibrio crossotus DSM 2876]UWO50609.1 hypothetical protein NQ527_11930 [Butyrivibrio crossotus]